MEETVKQRLIKYLKYKGLGQTKFEEMAGLSRGYISNLKKEPSTSKLLKILAAAPDLNQQWLITGEGEMLVDDNKNMNELQPFEIKNGRRVGIPLVSQYAYAGYLSGYADPEYLETLPIIDFTPDREMTGNWLAFEVKGDSMDDGTRDSYCQGDIVITREVEPHLWRDSRLHYNKRDFVIVHEEGILLKRVTNHNVESHTIVIHSLNPIYPDRTLNLAQVRQIFSVVESRQNRAR